MNAMATVADGGTGGRVVLGMGDNNLYTVDLETRRVVRSMAGHAGYIHAVATCGDSVVASGAEDGSVRLWDAAQQEAVHCMRPADTSSLARPSLGSHVASVAVTGDWLAAGGGPTPALWHLKSLALATSLAPASSSEVKVVMFHEDTVLVAGRGRKLYQATISGDMKAEVDMSSSVIYSLVKKTDPNVMCCAGSSSYIDILTNMYNYKDATIEFPVEE